MIVCRCPLCGHTLGIAPADAGQVVQCPICHEPLRAPLAAEPHPGVAQEVLEQDAALEAEAIQEAPGVQDQEELWADRTPRRISSPDSKSRPSAAVPEETAPFLTFDHVVGIILMGAGLLLLVVISVPRGGNGLVAVLVGGFCLVVGAGRFWVPEFMTRGRVGGLLGLALGLCLGVLVNLGDRRGFDSELAFLPALMGYAGAFVLSTVGIFGLIKG
jgi:hypothetical protein